MYTSKFFIPKSPVITVMRHAESAWNAPRIRVQGASRDPAICLSENGKSSIRSLLWPLPKPQILICSPLLRCRQTAETWFDCDFKKIPVPTMIEPDLREIEAGIFEGRYTDELSDDPRWKAWLQNPLTFSGFPNGETPLQFQRRVLSAFARIASQFNHSPKTVCVITHGIVMRVLKCFLDGNKNLSYLWHYQVKNLERITLNKENINQLQTAMHAICSEPRSALVSQKVYKANETAVSTCKTVVSNTGTEASSDLMRMPNSVHPKRMASAPD